MSDSPQPGVLYTEHLRDRRGSPLCSLWTYESKHREAGRPLVRTTADGCLEYWLDRSDPLLNTMLPGTMISMVINLGDVWACGRSLIASEMMPAACVVGPSTQSRILNVGRVTVAVGAVVPPTFARPVFGADAIDLVDRIVPLADLWASGCAERLQYRLLNLNAGSRSLLLRDELVAHVSHWSCDDIFRTAAQVITERGGNLSIRDLARQYGLSPQRFAYRFRDATGLAPKRFARLSRFQSLVHTLLLTDVAQWASVSSASGFYDQAHMINEFRSFAGQAPTAFFQPHADEIDASRIRVRGRPHEWLLPDA